MPTVGSATDVQNEISLDNQVTWRTIVCEETSQIQGGASISESKTKQCGVISFPSLNSVKITGSGIAGGDLANNQCSYLLLSQLRNAKTLIWFRRQNAASGTLSVGELTHFLGQGYIDDATETSAEGDVVKFNWGFTSTGICDFSHSS